MSDREEREEHIKRLEAALACEEKQFSGKCSKTECDDNCDLLYAQGNWGEWKETLRYAIDSLKTDLKYDLLYEETSEQADKPTTKSETLVSLEVYKQVAWERDIAIQQLHELGYEFGQKIEPTTKNDSPKYCDRSICLKNEYNNVGCEDCEVTKSQEPTAKNDHHRQNIQAYAHDFGVSEERAEKELRVTTKNDLAVDCIVDVLGSYTNLDIPYKREIAENILTKLPSVTPQEPKSEWQKDHEILKAYSDGINEALDKLRAEIAKIYEREGSSFDCLNALDELKEFIDKYKSESEE